MGTGLCNRMDKLLPFLALLLLAAITYVNGIDAAFTPSYPDEELRNIIVTHSSIVVGSSRALYRLEPDLVEVQKRIIETPNRLLVTDLNGTFLDKVLECGSLKCNLAPISNLSEITWHVDSGLVSNDTYNVVGIFALGPNGTSALTIGERDYVPLSMIAVPSIITKGELVNFHIGPQRFGQYAYQSERSRRERTFLTTFSHENFTYFLATVEVYTNGLVEIQIRLFRFCKEDKGKVTEPDAPPIFTSRYEIQLQCSLQDDMRDQELYSAVLVKSTEAFGAPTLLLAVAATTAGPDINDYVCAYSLDEINERIQTKYETCLDGGVVGDDQVGFERDGSQNQCTYLSTPAGMVSIHCLTQYTYMCGSHR